MKVIVRPRQMGKTTELIKMAERYDAVIVTHRYETAKQVGRMAEELGYCIRPPICCSTLKSDIKCGDIRNLIIDNAEIVLSEILGHGNRIIGMSISGVENKFYDAQKDHEQYEDFRRFRPDLTFQQFCTIKYGKEWEWDDG